MTVTADPAECSFQFDPVGTSAFTTLLRHRQAFLARNSVNYHNETAPAGQRRASQDRRQGHPRRRASPDSQRPRPRRRPTR